MSEESAVLTYRDEDTELEFRWHGGAYITIGCWRENNGDYPQMTIEGHGFDFEVFDVINVWNDELDESTFETACEVRRMAGGYVRRPFRWILEAFEDACREAIRDRGSDEEAAQ